jgi:hypothetical protein
MITAMQEFIEYLEKDYYINELTNFDKDKIQFLEKEKEQIIKAHENGQAEFDSLHYRDKNVRLSNNYYKQTYNQNE